MNPPTRRKLLLDASCALASIAGDMAKREARWLLEAASGRTGAQLLAVLDDVPPGKEAQVYAAHIRRRASGEPLQYVLGEAPFLRRMFHTGPGVLIPRPETELLAERALGGLTTAPGGAAVLDVGTGSGCIAVTLAAERPDLCIEAWDVSAEALAFAARNAERHRVDIDLLQRDVLEILQESGPSSLSEAAGAFRMIVSNPPYVHTSERSTLHTSVVDHEPEEALFASGDALVFYRALARLGRQCLLPEGALLVEVHADRGGEVLSLLDEAGYVEIQCFKDQFGRDRIVEARNPGDTLLSPHKTGR